MQPRQTIRQFMRPDLHHGKCVRKNELLLRFSMEASYLGA